MKTEQGTIYIADDGSKHTSKEWAARRNLGIFFETVVAEQRKKEVSNPWSGVEMVASYTTSSSAFREAVIKYHKEISE